MNALIEAAQTLEKGAAIIEERGWCQGTNLDWDNRVCVFGALALAMGKDVSDDYEGINWTGRNSSELTQMMVGSLLDVIDPPHRLNAVTDREAAGSISTHWNDIEGRTAIEVTTTMRSAAQRLYKKGTP